METKILIVDDEANILQQIYKAIEKIDANFDIFRAFDGFTALAIAKETVPDLIITDWDMPRMNGIELITQLKKIPELKQIPVIMCTGVMTNSNSLETALNAGAVDYIRKPIDEIEMKARIKSMLLLVQSFNEINEKNEIILHQKAELLKIKIDKKSKELTTYAMMLVKKEQEIMEVVQRLKEIYQIPTSKKVENIIREIIFSLEKKSQNNNSWNEFKHHFEEVHSDFFANLTAKYADLTQNDLKICALIRLNMVTKDIAQIVRQSPRTIEVARYRIRKKLKLDNNDNLYTFLMEF